MENILLSDLDKSESQFFDNRIVSVLSKVGAKI